MAAHFPVPYYITLGKIMEKGVLELVLADHVLRELHMQLVLGPAESGNAKWKFRRMCDWLAMAFANVRGKKNTNYSGMDQRTFLFHSPENLHILRYIRCEILDSPGSQDGVLVGSCLIRIVSGRQDEACLRLIHPGACQVAILQAGSLKKRGFSNSCLAKLD